MRHAGIAPFAAILAVLAVTVPVHAQDAEGGMADPARGKVRTAGAQADRSIARYLSGPVSEGKSPGLFAAILDKNGIRSIAAAGVRKQGSQEKFALGDLVHIGSNAKAMTSVMLARLVAEDVFANGWQTSIGEVFPELAGKIHSGYEAVSLDELLRMRGGIARNAVNWSFYRHTEIKRQRYQILRMNLRKRPKTRRGKFFYSNLSYMVAAAMAERLTGKSWEELMIDRVFKPLGMRTAGFGWPGAWRTVDQPWGHRRGLGGDWEPTQVDNPTALGPAGRVHLSIADYARFARLWFRGVEPDILDRKRLDYLATPHSGKYAAGWVAVRINDGADVRLAHSGGNTYWRVTVLIEPKHGRAYIAGANSAEKETHRMIDAIIQKLFRHER